MFAVFMGFASIAEILGLFIFHKIGKLFERKKIYVIAGTIQILGMITLFLTGIFYPQNIAMTALAGILIKFGAGMQSGIATVILADVVDYGEYKLKKRSESIIFSLQTLLVKFMSAFSALLVGFILDLTGYIPNQIQGPDTIITLRLLVSIFPIFFIILGYIVYKRKYILTQEYMDKIHLSLIKK